MDGFSIRNYTTEDYSSVKEILIEGGLFVETWDVEERLKNRILSKTDSIFVAVVNSEVCGCIYLIDDILPLVFRLAVKKNYRRKGIGTLLLEEAIRCLKLHGHKEIALLVDNKDQELKEWYYKQEFKTGTELVCLWKEI